ncbi:hypothetical protein LLEC1_02229 [Akanthomyces lecanii]|uniref:Branched-chain-amino-acid aminotransferase n=1 Tax=Cordyceps confragosa TaxID=2714763 RepID=A0A179I0H3_CORDF|nr:hypothetical protein LLEC1_02229 [Akanthomyces lecanii]
MSPSAVKNQSQDVNLTAAAVERKEVAAEQTPILAQLDASKMTYTYTKNPREVPDEAVANAGTETIATDHMVLANWSATRGWSAPELKPYGPLSLMPTASCLHYATECFEGLKVFRGYDGGLRCTEAGASNFFVLWKRKDGKKELITAPLDDKLILDGVTRRSAVELARERLAGEVEITERKYTIDELVEADAEGRILESFAAGTAYFICPVSQIHHRGKDINIPMGPEGKAGEITTKIKSWIGDIMYGNVSHEWGVVVNEKAQQ